MSARAPGFVVVVVAVIGCGSDEGGSSGSGDGGHDAKSRHQSVECRDEDANKCTCRVVDRDAPEAEVVGACEKRTCCKANGDCSCGSWVCGGDDTHCGCDFGGDFVRGLRLAPVPGQVCNNVEKPAWTHCCSFGHFCSCSAEPCSYSTEVSSCNVEGTPDCPGSEELVPSCTKVDPDDYEAAASGAGGAPTTAAVTSSGGTQTTTTASTSSGPYTCGPANCGGCDTYCDTYGCSTCCYSCQNNECIADC